MRDNTTSQNDMKDLLRFLIPSLAGIFLFIVPLKYNGMFTITVGILVSVFNKTFASILPALTVIIVSASALGCIIFKVLKPKSMMKSELIRQVFDVTPIWLIGRILGMLFAIMSFWKIGPEIIISNDTGTFVLYDLLSTIIAILIFAGLLLPLLLEYGMMEFCGTFVTKLFRPLFTLPGRASVDCLASWLGDASVGVVLTDNQYQSGYYSAREAAVVMTNFSAVSTTFCLVVIGQVGLSHAFVPFYLSVCIIGIICAIIMPRIPPLSMKKDTYYMEQRRILSEEIPEGYSTFGWAVHQAIAKAATGFTPKQFIEDGAANALKITMGAMPIVMTMGTFALILSTYTPVFEWLGKPFLPLLELLNIPEAQGAANTLMSGFVDMFIPAIVAAATIESKFTRFVVATVSITQLIFLSQAGSLMLTSKVPLNVVDLFFIFLERTIISIILAVFLARWLLPVFQII